VSAFKGSTGTAMGFVWSCKHRWGPWEIGRTERHRECTKCDQVDGENLTVAETHRTLQHCHGATSSRQMRSAISDKGMGAR
jgi:hypothetical protein